MTFFFLRKPAGCRSKVEMLEHDLFGQGEQEHCSLCSPEWAREHQVKYRIWNWGWVFGETTKAQGEQPSSCSRTKTLHNRAWFVSNFMFLNSLVCFFLRCWRFSVPRDVSRSCGDSAPLKAAHSFVDVDISIPSLDQSQWFTIVVFPDVWVNSEGNHWLLETNCTLSYLSVTPSEFVNAFGCHVIVPLTHKVYSSFCAVLG